MPPQPTVSIVIAAAEAGEVLPRALSSIEVQSYPNIIEVVVAAADNESADAARLFGATVVENPSGATPNALNLAIEASTGDVVVRCDAQSKLPEDYVERAVETLIRTGADNVGGMQVPVGDTFWERAIAAAMSSRLGAGDARYRLGGMEGGVETVYLGVFRRAALERVGGFDESFVRTQDYELNHRIIQSGGTVWFDPGLRVEYQPRGSLGSLARQYFEYGRAKRQFSRKHPGSLRWRQLAAPALVIGLVGSGLLSFFWPALGLVPGVYVAEVLAAGVVAGRHHGTAALGAPLALATMHLAWGLGFLSQRNSAPVGSSD